MILDIFKEMPKQIVVNLLVFGNNYEIPIDLEESMFGLSGQKSYWGNIVIYPTYAQIIFRKGSDICQIILNDEYWDDGLYCEENLDCTGLSIETFGQKLSAEIEKQTIRSFFFCKKKQESISQHIDSFTNNQDFQSKLAIMEILT